MNRLAALALTLAVAGCDSGQKDGAPAAASKDAALPDPTGKWEQRSTGGGPYLFTRYEFKEDHSFTRETGGSTTGVTHGYSGSWNVIGPEAADTKKDAGRPMGTLVLKCSVKSKAEIPVGATIVAQRGPALEADKQTFDVEERLPFLLTKTDDKEWLVLGLRRYAKVTP